MEKSNPVDPQLSAEDIAALLPVRLQRRLARLKNYPEFGRNMVVEALPDEERVFLEEHGLISVDNISKVHRDAESSGDTELVIEIEEIVDWDPGIESCQVYGQTMLGMAVTNACAELWPAEVKI